MTGTLVDALPQLQEQLTEAQAEAAAAQERVTALEQIIGGIRRLNGRAQRIVLGPVSVETGDAGVVALFPTEHNGNGAPEQEGHPRGREAVRIVTAERPGIWPLKDLVAEIMRREWADSGKSVEVSVHRLAKAGEARRVGIGVYEFPAPESEVESP